MKNCGCGCGNTVERFFSPGHQNKGKKHSLETIKKTRRPMELNGRWKGGRIVEKFGYILIKKPSHPHCDYKGYVREHRIVMEKHLGRFLDPSEVVHHINHNPSDNRIENLFLCNSQSNHIKECRTGRKFPRANGVWFICSRCQVKFYLSHFWIDKNVRYCSWKCRYPK
jgi:hypothetical protein